MTQVQQRRDQEIAEAQTAIADLLVDAKLSLSQVPDHGQVLIARELARIAFYLLKILHKLEDRL